MSHQMSTAMAVVYHPFPTGPFSLHLHPLQAGSYSNLTAVCPANRGSITVCTRVQKQEEDRSHCSFFFFQANNSPLGPSCLQGAERKILKDSNKEDVGAGGGGRRGGVRMSQLTSEPELEAGLKKIKSQQEIMCGLK